MPNPVNTRNMPRGLEGVSMDERTKWLWERRLDAAGPSFFDTFGEPQSVTTLRSDRIALTYPQGVKEISSEEARLSTHWKTHLTERIVAKDQSVCVELEFDDIPGAIYPEEIVWISHTGLPELTETFDLLSTAVQARVLEMARLLIPNPENLARATIERDIEEQERTIASIRADIVDLEAPGELSVDSKEGRGQERATSSFHGDTFETGGYRDTTVIQYFLTVGLAPKDERPLMWIPGLPGGRKSFFLSEHGKAPEDTAEEIRSRLLEERKKTLKEILSGHDPIVNLKIDGRIFTEPERWRSQYRQALEDVRKTYEDRWRVDDAAKLEELNAEWNERRQISATFHELSEEIEALHVRARSARVATVAPSVDRRSENRESLRADIQVYRDYIQQLRSNIEETLRGRREVEVIVGKTQAEAEGALRKAMEAPATPAPWFLHGVEPEIFEKFGRKPGEGFGEKVAGEKLFLPGDKPVVGIKPPINLGSRYSNTVQCEGLSPLDGNLPTAIGRNPFIVATVEKPDWCIRWQEVRDRKEQTGYGLVNERGVGTLFGGEGGGGEYGYLSYDWNGVTGAGPRREDVEVANGLAQPRSTQSKPQSQPTLDHVASNASTTLEGMNVSGHPSAVLTTHQLADAFTRGKKPEVAPVPKNTIKHVSVASEAKLTEAEKMTPELLAGFVDEVDALRGVISELKTLGAKPKTQSKDKPTDQEKALAELYEKHIPSLTEAVRAVQVELAAQDLRPERIRGIIADLRRRVEHVWTKIGVRAKSESRNDWIPMYLNVWKKIPAEVDANDEALAALELGADRGAIIIGVRAELQKFIPQLLLKDAEEVFNLSDIIAVVAMRDF
ncbi:MAG: hypothetical protein AAB473_02660 [Patescibacteria group bacterium]